MSLHGVVADLVHHVEPLYVRGAVHWLKMARHVRLGAELFFATAAAAQRVGILRAAAAARLSVRVVSVVGAR